jgi:hypothetical protein
MGILDYIYRLKPQAGDSSPHNEVGAGEVLVGGTITLVDRGGGNYAWQFASGLASIGLPAHTILGGSTGTGVTIAVTIKVTTYPATDFVPIVAYSSDDVTLTTGMHLDRAGSASIRARLNGGPSCTIGSHPTTTEKTFVLRLETSATSAQDYLRVWAMQVGRVGTAADFSSAAANAAASTSCDTLCIAATDGCVVQIKDLVIWHEELSEADCAAVADDLRGELDAGAPSDLTGGVTLDDALAAGTLSSAASDLTGDVGIDPVVAGGAMGSAGSSDLSGNATLDPAVAAGTLGQQTGVCTIPGFKNDNGGLQTSITVPLVTMLRLDNAAQVLVLTDQTTHAATGDLTVTNAALVAGTWYMAVGWNADGSQSFRRAVQAA